MTAKELIDPVQLTCELVEIPSESSDPQHTPGPFPEQGIVEHLRSLADQFGLAGEISEALPGRTNFMVRFKQDGAPKLLITAHMDTVSTRGMTDPFSARIVGNYLYGRGSCDDKGPLASALAALLNLRISGRPQAYDVIFAATVDEECSMSGASKLAEMLPPLDLCLALEPTGLQIIHAHKGVYRFRVVTRGKAVHSSAPEKGCNAIDLMLPILQDINEYGRRIARRSNPELGNACLSITRLHGGTSINIIPDICEAGVDIRLLPEMTPERTAAEIMEIVGGRGEDEPVFEGSGIRTAMDHPIIFALQRQLELENLDTGAITAAFATDCSKLSRLGPCIVWGPGSIDQAHKIDERIDIRQIRTGEKILRCFLTKSS